MKQQWEKLAAKYDALQQRERILVLAAVLVAIAAIMNALLLDPLAARKKILTSQMTGDSKQIQQMQQQIQQMLQAGRIDPDADTKQRLSQVREKLIATDAALDSMQNVLVKPENMPRLLESMLKKNGQLKLVSLQTLPVIAVSNLNNPDKTATENSTHAADYPLFSHGVEMTVEGRYLDLMNYLASLENLPWHILWNKAVLKAGDGGVSSLTITVNTLSLDQTWLSL